MKVLMVISQFHPIVGGTERQAQLLSQKLIKRGVDLKVVTGWWSFRTPREEIIDGIEVFRNFSCWGMFGIKNSRTLRHLAGLTYILSLGIYLFLHRRNYEIIHVHQALHPAFVSVLVGKQILGKPVIVKTASSGMTSDIRQLRQIPLGGFQLRYLLKKMDCLVAVSKAGGNDFKEIGYPESRIMYIPNGVEIANHEKTRYGQVKYVISTARLSKEKGIDILLRAWAEVIRREKGLKLVILGRGPLESELKRLSEFLGVVASVEFPGVVHNVERYLSDADLFVLPSRNEGLSNALLEAMSHGIPCIATTVGGNSELLEPEDEEILPGSYVVGKNGVLIRPDDVKGLSEAIFFLLRNEKVREAVGMRSRKVIKENYSIDSIAHKYIALYQRMLNERS